MAYRKRTHSRFAGRVFWIFFLLAAAAVLTWCFLPFDSLTARRSAESRGYTIPTSYSDSDYRYYYRKLSSSAEKEAYRYIVAELPDFPERIAVPKLSDDQLQTVFQAVSYDNPTFFFLGTKCSLVRVGSTYSFEPQYTMSEGTYKKELAQVKSAAKKLLADAPTDGTAYEQELYVHDAIGKMASYDSSAGNEKYTIYGLLVKHTANCEGYSRGMQYLCNRLGILTRVISGTASNADEENENHMWNIVTLNGQEYNVDATWDDYIVSGDVTADTEEPSHIYFNMPTDDMKKTHTADSEADWADCTSDAQYYFTVNHLTFSDYSSSKTKIRKEIVRQLLDGKTTAEFQYSNKTAYKEALTGLFTNNELYRLIALANYQVSANHRVSASKVQYTYDSQHNVIRIFLLR